MLLDSNKFRIEIFNHYLARSYPEQIKQMLPTCASRLLVNPGGGLWLRRL
jgi:hypothetical protein